jgi:hypothetical protein
MLLFQGEHLFAALHDAASSVLAATAGVHVA